MAAYLDVVARNLARDRFRRRRFLADAPVDDRPADAPDPEAQALSGLDGASVRAAMQRLPADYRAVLRLRLQEGLSSEEVARAMGRSGAAVRQLQHRALVALRREFARASLLPGTAAGQVIEATPAHVSTGETVAGHEPAGEMVAAGARRGRGDR
jgi:DNA-directed RNA polymerase specialized sigma24 family protein